MLSKTNELIGEINAECQHIRRLSEEIQEHYRLLGGLLMLASTLVPAEKWEAWLYANLGLDLSTAEEVIEGEGMEERLSVLSLPDHSIPKVDGIVPEKSNPSIEKKNGRRKKALLPR